MCLRARAYVRRCVCVRVRRNLKIVVHHTDPFLDKTSSLRFYFKFNLPFHLKLNSLFYFKTTNYICSYRRIFINNYINNTITVCLIYFLFFLHNK
jgi:hypothetical protein